MSEQTGREFMKIMGVTAASAGAPSVLPGSADHVCLSYKIGLNLQRLL